MTGYGRSTEGGTAPAFSERVIEGSITFSIIVFRPEITIQGIVD
jgi:hypothetical protein